jgi:hypothetical protein
MSFCQGQLYQITPRPNKRPPQVGIQDSEFIIYFFVKTMIYTSMHQSKQKLRVLITHDSVRNLTGGNLPTKTISGFPFLLLRSTEKSLTLSCRTQVWEGFLFPKTLLSRCSLAMSCDTLSQTWQHIDKVNRFHWLNAVIKTSTFFEYQDQRSEKSQKYD